MSKLDSTQLEQLKEIGEYLYQVRQEQAISLDEVANKTFIPLRLLRAIEVGRGDLLPEPVFIQGFIRRYADILGLDGSAIAKGFSTTTTPVPPPPTKPSAHPISQSPAEPSVSESRPANSAPGRGRSAIYVGSIAAGIALIAIIVYGISQLSSQSERRSTTTASPSPEVESPSPTAVSPSPVAASPSSIPSPSSTPSAIAAAVTASPSPDVSPSVASPSPSPSTSPSPGASSGPVQVNLNLVGRSWLRVVVDGKTAFEGTLEQGEQRTWAAQRNVTVLAGNAGGVSLAFNGGTSQLLGQPGEVVRKAFTPETPQTSPSALPSVSPSP
ncbi:MAG TPA: RodZ domain-containing protein [Crinalium sp.]